jgi:hypothetical protein
MEIFERNDPNLNAVRRSLKQWRMPMLATGRFIIRKRRRLQFKFHWNLILWNLIPCRKAFRKQQLQLSLTSLNWFSPSLNRVPPSNLLIRLNFEDSDDPIRICTIKKCFKMFMCLRIFKCILYAVLLY